MIDNYGKMMLTLFFAPGSSSMAPHIALHEIGAEFESRPLSFAKKENHAPEYLALNVGEHQEPRKTEQPDWRSAIGLPVKRGGSGCRRFLSVAS